MSIQKEASPKSVIIRKKGLYISYPRLFLGDVRKTAEQQARIQALRNFEPKLEKFKDSDVLSLFHESKTLEAGFIPETTVYCVKASGTVYPIELITILEEPKQYNSDSKYTIRIYNVDDIINFYLNDKLLYKAQYGYSGVEPNWQEFGHKPGDSGEIDITSNLVIGENKLRFELIDTGCCDVSGSILIKNNEQYIFVHEFSGADEKLHTITTN